METAVTTLQSHEALPFNGSNGPWTLNKFKAADGRTYQTSKASLANEALALLNSPVTVTYETALRNSGDRTFTNYEIKAIAAAAAGAPQSAPVASSSDDRQRAIMRQNALARALEMNAQGLVDIGGFIDLVKVAESCVKYYSGGYDHLLNGSAAEAQPVAAPASPPGDGGGVVAEAAPVASAPPLTNQPTAAHDGIPF